MYRIVAVDRFLDSLAACKYECYVSFVIPYMIDLVRYTCSQTR
jgi:hypothetical protein